MFDTYASLDIVQVRVAGVQSMDLMALYPSKYRLVITSGLSTNKITPLYTRVGTYIHNGRSTE